MEMEEREALEDFAKAVGEALAENNDIAIIDAIARAKNVSEFRSAVFNLLRSVFTYLNKKREDGRKNTLWFEKEGSVEKYVKIIVGKDVGELREKIENEGFSYYFASLLLAKMLDEMNRMNKAGNSSSGQ